MKFLLHTDLGHDPDDAIAIAFLCESGYIPDELVLHPGYKKQITISNRIYGQYTFLGSPPTTCTKPNCEESKYNPGKHSVFLERDIFLYAQFPIPTKFIVDKALVIGPPLGLGDIECDQLFMQGGYSPNSIEPLEKFKNIDSVPSYNPNGAKKDFNKIIESKTIKEKYFIGKNVCHGFTKEKLKKLWQPIKTNLFDTESLINIFWDKLEDSKAMHDVLAAALFINKEFGIWEQAKPVWVNGKLTTEPTNEKIYSLIGLKI
jgi:hypothetical protein